MHLRSILAVALLTATHCVALLKGKGNALLQEHPRVIPSGKRIGILVRGETFRVRFDKSKNSTACDHRAEQPQIRTTATLLHKIIEPFEALGNHVQVTFTAEHCEMNQEITRILENHIVNNAFFESSGQNANFRKSLDVFAEGYGGSDAVANKLDYVFVTRNDLYWTEDINSWTSDFNGFNFLARCESNFGIDRPHMWCVHDIAHWMPAKMFPAFDRTIGRHSCFDDEFVSSKGGHKCYNAIKNALQERGESAEITFMSNESAFDAHPMKLVYIGR